MGACDVVLKDSLGCRLLIQPPLLQPICTPRRLQGSLAGPAHPPRASPAVTSNFVHMRGCSSIRERGIGGKLEVGVGGDEG